MLGAKDVTMLLGASMTTAASLAVLLNLDFGSDSLNLRLSMALFVLLTCCGALAVVRLIQEIRFFMQLPGPVMKKAQKVNKAPTKKPVVFYHADDSMLYEETLYLPHSYYSSSELGPEIRLRLEKKLLSAATPKEGVLQCSQLMARAVLEQDTTETEEEGEQWEESGDEQLEEVLREGSLFSEEDLIQ